MQTYNRSAFHSVATDNNAHQLARCYCGLVLIELAIKDHLSLSNVGHNVPLMLDKLGHKHRNLKASLNTVKAQLRCALSNLHTVRNNGNADKVRPESYPDMRYIRHTSDFPSQCSTDADLVQLRLCVDRTRAFLRSKVRIGNPV